MTCWVPESTPPSSSSAPRPFPTRCAPPASTAPSASPECCRTSGPSRDFYPIDYLPTGVRLTAYSGGSSDLPATVLQRYLDRLSDGSASLGPTRVHGLKDIRDAHLDLEHNRAFGKHVVLP